MSITKNNNKKELIRRIIIDITQTRIIPSIVIDSNNLFIYLIYSFSFRDLVLSLTDSVIDSNISLSSSFTSSVSSS